MRLVFLPQLEERGQALLIAAGGNGGERGLETAFTQGKYTTDIKINIWGYPNLNVICPHRDSHRGLVPNAAVLGGGA